MMSRCRNIHNAAYKHYGAKGVTVCQDWLKVDNFIKDMGRAWKPGLSLDRRDANGPYSPENCRWIPRREQGFSENKRAYQEIQILKKELAEAKLLISELRAELVCLALNGWSISPLPPDKQPQNPAGRRRAAA